MIEVREIQSGSTAQAARAMLELRSRWETAEALVDFIDDVLRPAGYRIVGVFDDRESEALAVAGFREVRSLAWGHYLYVDDVSTIATARRSGHGERLMDWVRRCAVGSDAGVELRNGLRISAHHFEREI